MKTFFADTYFYVALLNHRDQRHKRVTEFVAATPLARMVTTEWVWMEVANALSGTASRVAVAPSLRRIRVHPHTQVLRATDDFLERGLELYEKMHDKDCSLTDCISFVVMSDHGLSEALTGDRHFEQAGYTAIFAGA